MSNKVDWGCCSNHNKEDEHVLCTKCAKGYHLVCLSLKGKPSNWICQLCDKKNPRGKNNDSTPIRNISNTRGNKRLAPNSPPGVASDSTVSNEDIRKVVSDVLDVKLNDIFNKLSDNFASTLSNQLKTLKTEISEMKDSMEFLSNKYEDMAKEHEKSKATLTQLAHKNKELTSTVTDLSTRINQLEQSARSNNVEIQCVPESKQENVVDIVKKLGSVVSCELTDKEIVHCTRIAKLDRNNPRPRSIIVQLPSPRARDLFMASCTKYNKLHPQNKLNSASLGLSGNATPIFVVEHLSPANKALHAATRLIAKKEKGYKYVWIRSGKIYVRKDDNTEYILIKNMDTLKKL